MYYNMLLPNKIYLELYKLMLLGFINRNSFDKYVNSFPTIKLT